MEVNNAVMRLKDTRKILERATLYNDCEAIDMAIAALERRGKEPCEYCKRIWAVAPDGTLDFWEEKINFCPKCGRKLEGKKWRSIN